MSATSSSPASVVLALARPMGSTLVGKLSLSALRCFVLEGMNTLSMCCSGTGTANRHLHVFICLHTLLRASVAPMLLAINISDFTTCHGRW